VDWLSKLPSWLIALALVTIAGAFVVVAVKQPDHFEFAGLGFGRVHQADLSLDDAVIAFDRGECPDGWKKFEPAAGRMIVGAARSGYPSYSQDPEHAIGGEETVTLTIKQMPSHTHDFADMGLANDDSGSGQSDREWVNVLKEIQPTLATGGGEPHNNMPPYVALYYCERE